MLVLIRTWIHNPTPEPHFSSLNPIRQINSKPPRTLIIKMSSKQNSKRQVCSSCSRPISVCLCNRIRNPGLENPVSVTILQHSLENKHPLNSARIVKLGLKNVSVVDVYDVNWDARFEIRVLNGCRHDACENASMTSNSIKCSESEDPAIVACVGKYGFKCKLNHNWTSAPQIHDFDGLMNLDEAINSLSKGFSVKKMQVRLLDDSIELEEYEEYELMIPPGSILLFPSDESLGVEALAASEFEVKNLIVLDGTWAKAKRMYNENPWLKLLPHLKLDLNKTSVYGEVRIQPKAGYLSTIESIVYALKALGGDNVGLDNLLDVFESMVKDQRRYKDERMQKLSTRDQ